MDTDTPNADTPQTDKFRKTGALQVASTSKKVADEKAKPLLTVRKLTKTFGSGEGAVTAVNNVSLELYPGEIVALVGESGSGKSTLARLLLRLLAPTSGDIELSGQNVTKGPKHVYWREVQAVFQDPFASFNQFYNVRRVLLSALGVLKKQPNRAEKERRLKEALAQVGLSESLLNKRPFELSGGQRQRVMMARALMLKPELLIADEPTSMLDASLRVSILNQLKDVRDATGTTLLLITHDLGQAYYVSDRLLVMYKGELVESGPTEQVVAQSQHPYTRSLIADVPTLH